MPNYYQLFNSCQLHYTPSSFTIERENSHVLARISTAVSRGQTACDQIAFFAFHAFVVEDSIMSKNRVRAKLYKKAAQAFLTAMLRLGLRASLVARDKSLLGFPKILYLSENEKHNRIAAKYKPNTGQLHSTEQHSRRRWGGGVLDIFFAGEVRPGPSKPDPAEDKNCPIFDTLFKTFCPNLYSV